MPPNSFDVNLFQIFTRGQIGEVILDLLRLKDSINELNIIAGIDFSSRQEGEDLLLYFLRLLEKNLSSFSNNCIATLLFSGDMNISLPLAKIIFSIQKQFMSKTIFDGVIVSKNALEWLCPEWRNKCGYLKQNWENCYLAVPYPDSSSQYVKMYLQINNSTVKLRVRQGPVVITMAEKVAQTCLDFSMKTKLTVKRLKIDKTPMSIEAFSHLLGSLQSSKYLNELMISQCPLLISHDPMGLDRTSESNFSYRFTEDEKYMTIYGYDIGLVQAAVFTYLIQIVSKMDDIHSLQFLNTKLKFEALHYLLGVIQEQEQTKQRYGIPFFYLKFRDCIFQSADGKEYSGINLAGNYRENLYIVLGGIGNRNSDNNLGEKVIDSIKLIKEYPVFPKITGLDMEYVVPNGSEITYICQQLEETKLKFLSLDVTCVTMEGIDIMVGFLRSNKHLEELRLYCLNDEIGESCAVGILETLKTDNMTLKKVILQGDDTSLDDFDETPLGSEIDFYLDLNQLGRSYILSSDDIPAPLFPLAIEKAEESPSMIYWILQRFPHVLSARKVLGQKRRRLRSQG